MPTRNLSLLYEQLIAALSAVGNEGICVLLALADIASATNRQIRLFNVRKNPTDAPTTVVKATWELSSPRSVEGFSAVGYYFGRDLQQVRRVPVGLIGTY